MTARIWFRGIAIGMLVVAAAAWGAGCAERPADNPPRPPDDRTVVSMVPSVIETLYAMGLGDRVVGRGRYCDYPPEARELPVVGDAVDLDLEAVLRLDPDLVIFNTSKSDTYDRLSSSGIECLAPRMETVGEVYDVVDLLGRKLGAEQRATELSAELHRQLDAVRKAAAGAPEPSVLVTFPGTLASGDRVRVIGRATFVDELLEAAGGRNVAPEEGYPRVSIETIVRWAPEVIIVSAPGDLAPGKTDAQYREPWLRWKAIPAVADDRVVVLRESFLTLPGPRMGAAARLLLGVLHPDRSARLERSTR